MSVIKISNNTASCVSKVIFHSLRLLQLHIFAEEH